MLDGANPFGVAEGFLIVSCQDLGQRQRVLVSVRSNGGETELGAETPPSEQPLTSELSTILTVPAAILRPGGEPEANRAAYGQQTDAHPGRLQRP
jgi:hypothetical protein